MSGIWSGLQGTNGAGGILILKLDQRGQKVSGTLGKLPILNGEFNGDLLSFDVQETVVATLHYQLTLTDGGLGGEISNGNGPWPVRTLKRWDAPYSNWDMPYSNSPPRTSLPVLVYRVEPQYPKGPFARAQGPVVLQIEIDESGRVLPDRIKVLRSIGADFDQKAIECVKQWRFQPEYIEGNPVSTIASVEVVFTP